MARSAFSLPAALALCISSLFIAPAHGYHCLFMGHSFFAPIARAMPDFTAAAGVSHTQNVVSRGGQNGSPEALWNDAEARGEIQGFLDAGDVEFFGMAWGASQNNTDGYELWFDYALSKNPDTKFMLGGWWLDYPSEYDAAEYATLNRMILPALVEDTVAELRGKYPGVSILHAPYGIGVAELRLLFDAGLLRGDLSDLTGPGQSSLFTDYKGHAGAMIRDVAPLMWLNRIYGVDLLTYEGPLGYRVDVRAMATAVLDAYDAGSTCGNTPCSCVDDDARMVQIAASQGETWVTGCADVFDYCEEGIEVRRTCCGTCFFPDADVVADNSASPDADNGAQAAHN